MPSETWTRRVLALAAAILLPLLGAPVWADEIVVYTRGGKIRFDEDVGRDLMEAILVTYDTGAKGAVKKETLEVYKHLSADQEIITPGQITEACQKAFVIQKVGDIFFFRGPRTEKPKAAGGAIPATPSTPATPAAGSGAAGASGGSATAGSGNGAATGAAAGSAAGSAAGTAAGSATPASGGAAAAPPSTPKASAGTPAAGAAPETGAAGPKAGATAAGAPGPEASPSSATPKAAAGTGAGTTAAAGTAGAAAGGASTASTAATLSPEAEGIQRPLTDAEVVRSVRDKVRRVTREITTIDPRQKGSAKLRASIISREFTTSLAGFDEAQMKQVVGFVHEEELSPNREYYVLRSFGWAFHAEKQYDKAVYFYDGCIALIPENYSAFLQKGYALDKAGRQEEALGTYITALCMRPRRAVRYLASLLRRTHTTPRLTRPELNLIREAFGPVVRGLQNRDTDEAKARAEELAALTERLLSGDGGSAPATPPPLPEEPDAPKPAPTPTPTPTTTDGGTP